jgi:M6 family metalloprotease-like protein
MSDEIVSRTILFSDDFEHGVTDVWDLERGWGVERHRVGYYLSGVEHSWARLRIGREWSNYSFQCHLKLVRGAVHLNYRLSDEGRYFIGFREGIIYLKKEAPWGEFFDLAAIESRFDLDVWHDMDIVGEEGHLKIYIDDSLKIDYIDRNPLTNGSIAFETLDESHAQIDNVKVTLKPVLVTLLTPKKALFVGSYVKIPVLINPNSGLTIDDLEFVVPAGPNGGTVSLSRDKNYDHVNPDIILLTGYEPGTYHLQAIEKSSGSVVADSEFSVNTYWGNDQEGPSLWVSGDYVLPGVSGATWGGGSPTDPENFNIIPAIGTNNVAILLVDTSSQRFSQNEIQAVRNLWQDVAFNGRVHNGRTVSTAHYFREASYNNFNITGQVFGPVHLPGSWSDYLQDNGNYKGNLWHACATAGDALINYSNFQHLVCVIKSVPATATTPQRRVWAHADSILAKVAEGDIPLGTVSMPADGTHFNLSATLAHELGHNLGLGDIYPWGGHPPQIQARHLNGWALMAWQSGLPHPVLVHRMRLGWIPQNNLKLYNFQAIAGSVDETVTLHPVELANPPGGRYTGVEVRIAPDYNYYFEYRVAQSTQIGDQSLPTNDRVLGTDVSFAENYEDAARRKPVMLLPNDIDGDGPVLGNGQDYEEQDVSPPDGPNFPTDFSATVTNIDGTKADVRVQYGVYSQPDPSIRPWSPPVYKSPDIEVRNARSQADSKWLNVPWENHHNTLVAKVTNRGSMNAPQVWVDFYVKDYTVNRSGTQPPPKLIGSDHKNVPANRTIEFTTIWMPLKAGHYCIEAKIRHYMTPGPNPVLEITEYNNRAQSNYDRFISAKSSAPSREIASVKVQNPYSKATRVFIRVVKSSTPLYRTYLEYTWLWLQPGETRDVQVMFEYAYEEEPVWEPNLEQYIGMPNDVSIYAMFNEPDAELEQAPVMLGGVTAQVITGRATQIKDFVFDPPTASGEVVTVDTGEPVPGGKVILIIKRVEEENYRETEVSQNGIFTISVPREWDSIQAYYVPLNGYADSTSHIIEQ